MSSSDQTGSYQTANMESTSTHASSNPTSSTNPPLSRSFYNNVVSSDESGEKEPPPQIGFTRVSKEKFLESLRKRIQNKDALHGEEKMIRRLREVVLKKAEELYNDPSCPLWNLTLTDTISRDCAGIYFAQRHNGKTKFGSSVDCKTRTKQQANLKHAWMVMTPELVENILGIRFINAIANIGLPALHYDPERHMELRRTICLQIGEGILGCGFHNDCNIYFEKLIQVPTESVRQVINIDRMLQFHEYATRGAHGQSHEYIPFIEFNRDIPDRGVRQLYSWPTLKSYNRNLESDFMRAQQPLPKDGKFATNRMAMQRLGRKFQGYIDATECPAVNYIRDECLAKLQPLLQAEIHNPAVIRAALEPIWHKNWDSYMRPSTKALADGTIHKLEQFLKDPTVMHLHTQCNNFESVQEEYPEWMDAHFDAGETLQYGRSQFLTSKDGKKRLTVHPAHFLLYSHCTRLKVRFALAEDYLFHMDLMLANNYMSLSEVQEKRRIIQAYLMNLTYDEVKDYSWASRLDTPDVEDDGIDDDIEDDDIEDDMDDDIDDDIPTATTERTSFHLARNCAFPNDWFKFSSNERNIKGTSRVLNIQHEVFIHLRAKLGEKDTRTLVVAHGMLWSGKQEMTPYEVGAKCLGTPEFGPIQAKPCCGEGLPNRNRCLNYVGVGQRADETDRNENHPIFGYAVCKHCYRNVENIERYHLQQQAASKGELFTDSDRQRLDTLERRMEQRAIHQANYHAKCIAIEGQQAVETKDRLKSLNHMSKTIMDPELRAQQNLNARNQEQKRLENGGEKKKSGKRRRGNPDPDFRYPGRLRKKMKQAVYVQMNMYGSECIYRNHIINLLDGIRKHYTGNDDDKYYDCEYKRCISAFLKPDDKQWWPKDDRFKLSQEQLKAARKIRSSMTSEEFHGHVLKLCLDESKMKKEKAFSDSIPFGTGTV